MPSQPDRPSRPADLPRPLSSRLRVLRRRWRLAVLGRGARWALGLTGAAVILLGALSAFGLMPAGFRPGLRWLPVVVGVAAVTAALLRTSLRAPSDRTLALALDEERPDLEFAAVTLVDLPGDHPYAGSIRRRVEAGLASDPPSDASGGGGRSWPSTGRAWSGPLLLAALAAFLLHAAGGPGTAWAEWGAGAPPTMAFDGASPPTEDGDATEGVRMPDLPDYLELTVIPPRYTGLPERPAAFEEGVEALAGSRLRLTATPPPGMDPPETVESQRVPALRRVGGDAGEAAEFEAFVPDDGRGWAAELVLAPSDRGLVLRHGSEREWILPLTVRPDGPPRVELLEPERDLVLATGSGEIAFRARARDPHGLDDFALSWVHTRGSGESFDFRDGRFEWDTRSEGPDGSVEGRLILDLDRIGLGAGEVLHLRAIARDRNDVTGPGEGVSGTRQIRVIREGDEMSVDALVGLPLEVEQEPVLSQRMILLMTGELIENAPGMDGEAVRAEAMRISREQARLRARIGEDIYSRATGAMEEVVLHLGVDDPVPPTGAADAHAPEPPASGSRYGVASIFDPAVRDARDPGHDHAADSAAAGPLPASGDGHDHGHSHGDPLDFGAGTDVPLLTLGRISELPTGFGTLEDLGHAHDGDPILSVNQALLAVHDAMWESERYLSLIEPARSVPHQEEALERLQEMRQSERVFPRGRVTVPPVDVVEARGTGDIEDAAPAARSRGAVREDGSRWLGPIDELLRRLNGSGGSGAGTGVEAGGDPAGDLHRLALDMLGDGAVDAAIAGQVVRASRALSEGRRAEAGQELLEARRGLSPGRTEAAGAHRPGVRSVLARPDDDDPARTAAAGEATRVDVETATPFVFATLRYESGNWDSAPLVPQNLIHSLAQYTALPVAPEGVVVDLSSPEIFRYPVLYLTGHLPVRFTDAESRNLETYVRRGGFVFMDDHNHDIDGAFHRTATAELARIFGEDALEPLPNDHELYRTFFHFEDGPPTTSHELSGWGDGLIHPHLHAVMVDGRIGVLYSNKDYSSEWSYHAVNKRFLARDNTRFGVNLILYALTR